MTVQQYELQGNGFTRKSEITVFLTLIMVVILGLLLTVIYISRVHVAKFLSEAVLDMALKSAFSEYNKRLFEEYDLIYVDTAYHGECGGDDDFCNHVKAYINENLAEIYKLSVREINVISSEYAYDNDYKSLLMQITKYEENLGNYGSDDELIDYYISEKFDDTVIDKFKNKDSTGEKLELIANEIEKNMKAEYSYEFSFTNLLYMASLEVVFESEMGSSIKATAMYNII